MHTLLASAAKTASGTSVVDAKVAYALSRCVGASFLLDVTAAATETGDKLDVYVQTSIDGTTYDDLLRFTQVLGDGGAKKFIAYWHRGIVPSTPLGPPQDGAMSAGVKQGPMFGNTMRVKWVVTSSGTVNESFTFSVKAQGFAS